MASMMDRGKPPDSMPAVLDARHMTAWKRKTPEGQPGEYPRTAWNRGTGDTPRMDVPVDFSRFLLVGGTHALGAELVAAGTLAPLGHRDLPPGIPRQRIAALLHGAPLAVLLAPAGPENRSGG